MTENKQNVSVQSLVSIFRRRGWWLIVPALLGPVAGILLSTRVTPVYKSQCLVLVEQPKIQEKFITPVISDQMTARLSTMKDQIMSRSSLEPIITRLNLYSDSRRPIEMQDRVLQLRKAIDLKPLKNLDSSPSGFYITAAANRAELAQNLCREILSKFLEENLAVRKQRAEGTTEFLGEQLQEAKHKLDAQDAQLAEFKRQYFGKLPSDEQRNLEMLNSTRVRLETVNQELSQAQQQKIVQESMLAQQLRERNPATPGGSRPTELQTQLASLQEQLTTLKARYTDEYPDVIKVKAQIASVRQQIASAQAAAGSSSGAKTDTTNDTPEIRQTRVSIHLSEESIRSKRAEQQRLQGQAATLQERLQLSPTVEERYKSLTRDYETALQFYNDLLGKQKQSEMATDLERKQEGEQFLVMDQPDLPAVPSFPNRLVFAAGGLFAGLILGICMVAVLELRERFIRTEEDVLDILGLPVLVSIPLVSADSDLEKSREVKSQEQHPMGVGV